MTIMTQLKSCTFNCRGWNNGVHTLKHFIDSLDLCFVQEHWLLNDHLHKINDISSNFLSVSVSGMINSEFVCGRPFGGINDISSNFLSVSVSGMINSEFVCGRPFGGINDISSNFLSVSVSGMINSEFVCGRPFGGINDISAVIFLSFLLHRILEYFRRIGGINLFSSL